MRLYAVAVGREGTFVASRLDDLPEFPERRLFLIPAPDPATAREWGEAARCAAVLIPYPPKEVER